MSTPAMTLPELEAALDTHGPRMERWPADEMARAQALIASSPAARMLLREAEALDVALHQALAVPAIEPARVRGAVMARLGTSMPLWERTVSWLVGGVVQPRRYWRPALVAFAPLLIGFALGMATPGADEPDEELVAAVSLLAISEATVEEFPDAQ